MYQCKSFYSANRIYPKNLNMVAAAWWITVDEAYSYEMNEGDLLDLPNMFCFIRTIDGVGVVETVDNQIVMSQNEFIILPRKDIVRYRSNSKIWSYYWVDYVLFHGTYSRLGVKMSCEYSAEEKAIYDDLLELGRSQPNEAVFINGVFSYYYYKLFSHNNKKIDQTVHSVRFSEIVAFIDQKIYSKLTVHEIAEFFGVSTRRIHQIITSNVEKSPKQYISSLKISKAKEILVESAVPITDIADLLGYDSAYHFSSSFSKKVGCSPSAYRKNQSTQNQKII